MMLGRRDIRQGQFCYSFELEKAIFQNTIVADQKVVLQQKRQPNWYTSKSRGRSFSSSSIDFGNRTAAEIS